MANHSNEQLQEFYDSKVENTSGVLEQRACCGPTGCADFPED